MSLTTALSSATSSLMAIEQQMAVASGNISNANTTGYTEQTATTTTTATGGVSISAIVTSIDQYLLKDIVGATSTASYASTISSYYSTLQESLGTLTSTSSSSGSDDSSDISSQLTTLESDLSSLATTPDSASLKSQVVSDLDDVTSTLRSLSSTIQGERSDAEQQIGTTVNDVNTQLDTIQSLNVSIAQATADGQSTATLQDERMTALQNLSSDMGVSYFVDGNGNMQVYTSSGQALIDSTNNVHTLSTSVAPSLSESLTYSAGSSSGIDGIYVDGTDITDSVSSGTLGALVQMRDDVLPGVQSELDNLASSLSTAINSVANQGTADPPPDSLTGTTDVSSTDAVSVAAGTTVRLVITDSDGDTTSYQDVDLSGATSVNDIVNDLDQVPGVTASVTDGHLELSVADGSGIAVSTLSGSVGGTDLSSYFGLNDVITGGSSAATISVSPDLLSSSGDLPSGSLESTQTVGSAAIGASDATVATELYNALANNTSFGAAGSLGATSTSLAGYAADIVSQVATNYTNASDTSSGASTKLSTLTTDFSNESGVNVDDETAKLQALEDSYSASAEVVSALKSMFNSLIAAIGGTAT